MNLVEIITNLLTAPGRARRGNATSLSLAA